ncbi:hypothetical protein P389DRAFT_83509 [Cystobasidium minutum MCA 4210]|uniref:mitochondrial 37S ribosomal protein bS1m n=1 Tax=Cystobasidium minutum MCA 4210 TaxID=1397322 RepID=UPI0034CF214F|eukprot:jgi/Rhomi1/83509/CE83508_2564
MASQTAAQASTSFGRLLKSSKVVSQFDASIPLVYTTHGGSKKRSDYGLKRALPEIKTAAIRVHSLDNSMTKLTDFSYAAREHCFVDGFRESNVKAQGHAHGQSLLEQRSSLMTAGEAPGGCAWDKNGFQSVEELKSIAKGGKTAQKGAAAKRNERAKQAFQAIIDSSSTSSSSEGIATTEDASSPSSQEPLQFAPDYAHMSESRFKRFLSQLEELGPKFRDWLLQTGRIDKREPIRVQLKELYAELNKTKGWGGVLDPFLAQELPAKDAQTGSVLNHDPKLDRLAPSEHYAFGLTYAAPNTYMSDQAIRPLPLRRLDNASSKENAGMTGGHNAGAGSPSIVLGTLTNVATHDQPKLATLWNTDAQGNYSLDYGRGAARVESASIQHPSTKHRERLNTPDEVLYGVDVKLVDDPSKKPTIMDEDVVSLKVYKAGKAEGSLKPKRIGSPEWVGSELSRTSAEDRIRTGDVQGLFKMQDSAASGHRYIRYPSRGGYTGPSQVPGRKHQIREGSESSPASIIARLRAIQTEGKK